MLAIVFIQNYYNYLNEIDIYMVLLFGLVVIQ